MYSPKISEALVPHLYHLGKKRGVKMTVLVNQIIAREIQKQKKKGGDLYNGQDKGNPQPDTRDI
jgi:hypothetical protein